MSHETASVAEANGHVSPSSVQPSDKSVPVWCTDGNRECGRFDVVTDFAEGERYRRIRIFARDTDSHAEANGHTNGHVNGHANGHAHNGYASPNGKSHAEEENGRFGYQGYRKEQAEKKAHPAHYTQVGEVDFTRFYTFVTVYPQGKSEGAPSFRVQLPKLIQDEKTLDAASSYNAAYCIARAVTENLHHDPESLKAILEGFKKDKEAFKQPDRESERAFAYP